MDIAKDLVKILLTSLGSLITLFILTKLIGNKQMSQLTMYDYIVSISIGSIAAEMAYDADTFHRPFFAMIIYASLSMLISYCCTKSMKMRRLFTGRTFLLFKNGVFYKDNMKKVHLDLNEFLMQCRTSGYFDLNELSVVFMEPTGKLSFLPNDNARPATCADLSATPKITEFMSNVIIDGEILTVNLSALGKNEAWLQNALKEKDISDHREVFLATLSQSGNLSIFTNSPKSHKNSPFE